MTVLNGDTRIRFIAQWYSDCPACVKAWIYAIDMGMVVDINIDIICPIKVGVRILEDGFGPQGL